ncbi:endonuclease 2 [Spinacia oleracea]|uniref:Aspergillus nuclease S1 n=1 Tax=Spinacia oleracea TaxID=3562 RepID=A0A9R0HW37_SPIOL|nr:endonuclease 2 [Spinacia oleracea]
MTSVKLSLGFLLLALFFSDVHCWGTDGHTAVCRIAQSRLNEGANEAVMRLLPDYAEGDLGSVCSWADHVKFHYQWSSSLHYINVPDSLCTFQYNRDCKDEDGVKDNCVAGAINNYTTQLLAHKNNNLLTLSNQYNGTEALLFLSHFMGDIHQPLHVSHASDKGGNTIDVHWYTRKTNLHHVWDDSIMETEEQSFYHSNLGDLIHAIQQNITKEWADQVPEWENCAHDEPTCPNIYASESIEAACSWAYKDADEGSTLEDDYFISRLPIVNLRLAQAGVRLAATLNRLFF